MAVRASTDDSPLQGAYITQIHCLMLTQRRYAGPDDEEHGQQSLQLESIPTLLYE